MSELDLDRTKDMCPICKTDRYLSPNMTFLVNPECYHKICESCVDRIFSLGPAPCPYPKCGKILRKNKFKKQVFEDLNIEREIDIRKRITNIYNKTLSDFKGELRQYNFYLEEVEDIIYKLTNGMDVDQIEMEISKYEQEHKQDIVSKNLQIEKDLANFESNQVRIRQLNEQKLKLQRQMEQEEQEFRAKVQSEILDNLTNDTANPQEIINQYNNKLLKRTSLRQRQLQELTEQINSQVDPKNKNTKILVEVPFTPFNGDRELARNYKITNPVDDPVMKLNSDKSYLGGGFRVEQYFERVLQESLMGLGVMIEVER